MACDAPSSTCVVGGLQPDTQYRIYLQAYISGFFVGQPVGGEVSLPLIVKTKFEGKLRNLSLEILSLYVADRLDVPAMSISGHCTRPLYKLLTYPEKNPEIEVLSSERHTDKRLTTPVFLPSSRK